MVVSVNVSHQLSAPHHSPGLIKIGPMAWMRFHFRKLPCCLTSRIDQRIHQRETPNYLQISERTYIFNTLEKTLKKPCHGFPTWKALFLDPKNTSPSPNGIIAVGPHW